MRTPPAPENEQNVDEFDENYEPENWADFLQYQRPVRRGVPEIIENSTFYVPERYHSSHFYATSLYRNLRGEVKIHILSKFLRDLLQNCISTQGSESVVVEPTSINIRSPFTPLYHYLDDMKRAVHMDTKATKRTRPRS